MSEVKNDVALIRKRDVQKLICKLNGCVGTIRNFENCEKRCFDYKAVDELPIVQQRQRVGRWEDDAGFDKCSECGASYSDLAPDYDRTNYCPKCGAKMNGSFGVLSFKLEQNKSKPNQDVIL